MRYLFFAALFNVVCGLYEKDITFIVLPGTVECFYHKIPENDTIDLEFQVIDATHGELEISFQLSDPIGLVLITDYKKPENAHRYTATLTGDYRFCFDNNFSTFSRKTVFFDLLIESEGDEKNDQEYDEDDEMTLGGNNSAEAYVMKVHLISDSIFRLQHYIHSARRQQELHAAHEARDRNMAEEMCARVMTWSLCQIMLMLTVGITQVFFLKSLFDSDSTYKKYVPSFAQ